MALTAAVVVPSVIGGGLALWVLAGLLTGRHTVEHAKYATVKAHKAFELRRYAPCIQAQTTVLEADVRRAGSLAFRRLAAFIFGQNVAPRPSAFVTDALVAGNEKIGVCAAHLPCALLRSQAAGA